MELTQRWRVFPPHINTGHGDAEGGSRLGLAGKVFEHVLGFHPPMLGAPKFSRNRCHLSFSQSSNDNQSMSSIGDRVKYLRELHGFSQAGLARRLGISAPSLSEIEHNHTKSLKGKTLNGMCEHLRTTADYLIHGVDEEAGLQLATMEAELLFVIRALAPDRRMALMEFARHLLAQEPGRRAPPSTGPASVSPIRKPPKSPKSA